MNSPSSLYMLLFRDCGVDVYRGMSPEERQKLLTRWNEWYDGLVAAGIMRSGYPLHPEARIVTAEGIREIDGPYAEAKEAIGGYFLIARDSFDAATEIAKNCPSLALGLTVEVRAVAEICPTLKPGQATEETCPADALVGG